MRKRESVILTRRRGDAEISAEKRRSQREDERGDSGGWWPSVRSGRAFQRENKAGAAGRSRIPAVVRAARGGRRTEEESCQFWQEPNYAGTRGRGFDGRMGAPGRVAASRAQTLTITSRSRSRVRKNLTLSKRANSFSRLRLLNNCTGRRMPCRKTSSEFRWAMRNA